MKQKGIKRIQELFTVLLAAAILVAALPVQKTAAQTITPTNPVVIVLDAGHGGADGGAMHRWNGKLYKEKDANLAIAKACKKKLETYSGVKVYMTRSSDYYVGLEKRVQIAKGYKADLFVALHNNASLSSKTKGACVYYPNSHYNAKLGAKGKLVAQSIQNRLTALGLKNNGIMIRNSSNRTRYPDKSLSDYYSVIRNSKSAGFAGLIVEHAYISNSSDCTKYLGSSEMLTKLGEADATGIASYYGLMPKTSVNLISAKATENDTIQLQWSQTAGVSGYCVYRRDETEDNYRQIKKIAGAQKVTYTDKNIVRGVNYEYVIYGYHTGANATTYTNKSNVREALCELPVPQNLALKQTADGNWELTWDAASGVSGYRIVRTTDDGDDYEQIAEISGEEQTSYILKKEDLLTSAKYSICSYYEDDDYDAESEYASSVTGDAPLQ